MSKTKLSLFACPALLACMLLAPNPAHANQTVNQPTDTVKSAPAQPLAEIVFERPNLKSPTPEVATPQSDD